MSGMPWFPFYVDDFMASPKVARMSMEEVGVYVLLLCQQHQEGAVEWPCERIASALRGHERDIEYVLSECFHETSDGWKNRRLERIHNEQAAKSKQASKAAKARWETASDADASANAKRTQSGSDANQNQNQTRKEYTSDFEQVWGIHGRGPKRKAFDEYRKSVPKRVSHDELTSRLTDYVSSFDKDFNGAHLFRWIRDERWEEHIASNGNGKGHWADKL